MQFKMPKKLFGILALSSLASCAANTTVTAPRTVHDYCLLATGIFYAERHGDQVEDKGNKYDTDETVKEIKNQDLIWEKTCDGSAPTSTVAPPEKGAKMPM